MASAESAAVEPGADPTAESSRQRSRSRLGDWNRRLASYQQPTTARSIGHVVVTAGGFLLFWSAALQALAVGFWLTLLLAVPAALFLVRLFILQHDCGHYSLFRSSRACDWLGSVLGVLTLTPYTYWRLTHSYHHTHNGNLDRRGVGDIDTLTVTEYAALGRWKRFGYRMMRHPLVLFGLGPLFQFGLKHRFPWDLPRSSKRAWRSVWWTNGATVATIAAAMLWLGPARFLAVQGPITLFACAIGVWLFYVQHQFAETYWSRGDDWDPVMASLQGSSYLALGQPLQWLTGNIGLHHVHHLSSRIPHYLLPRAMAEVPELAPRNRLTLTQALHCSRLHLWDERTERLISFREWRRTCAAVETAAT